MVLSLCSGVSGQVLGTGSDNIGGLGGDDGTVGVSDKSSIGQTGGVGYGGVDSSVGGEMLKLGSNNSGLVGGDNGAVGVGNQATVSGVSVRGRVCGVSSGGVGVSGGGVRVCAVGVGTSVSVSVRVCAVDGSPVGGEVGCTSEGHSGLIGGYDSTVGMSHQVGGGDSDTGGENQKLHVDICKR